MIAACPVSVQIFPVADAVSAAVAAAAAAAATLLLLMVLDIHAHK